MEKGYWLIVIYLYRDLSLENPLIQEEKEKEKKKFRISALLGNVPSWCAYTKKTSLIVKYLCT